MTPRVKYEAPRMAAEFTPISQKAVEPILRPARVVERIDLGYQPRLVHDRPTRVRSALPEAPEPEREKYIGRFEPRVCLDCPDIFTPKAWNHVRCFDCAYEHKKKLNRAREERQVKPGSSVDEATRKRAMQSSFVRNILRRSA